MKNVVEIKHPLLQHKLSLMRKKETSSQNFLFYLEEISIFLAYEVTKQANTLYKKIKTPLQEMQAPFLADKFTLISILRAGDGLLRGMMKVLPNAKAGHIGIYRDPKTLEAVQYYYKLPNDLSNQKIILLDPMLATGHSAAYAIEKIKKVTTSPILFICLLAAPEGIKCLEKKHPNTKIITVAIDEKLNEKGYILPGLGDAGDRIFYTK